MYAVYIIFWGVCMVPELLAGCILFPWTSLLTRSTLTSPLRGSGFAVVPSFKILPALNSVSSLHPAGSTRMIGGLL